MDYHIRQFWQWFSQNEAVFRNPDQAERAKEMLDNQVLTFGKFAWGIDRGPNDSYILIISPNNNKQLLDISRQLVDEAPALSNWDFLYCKPPLLDWDFKIRMFNQFYLPQLYDASKWQFVLIEEEDYRVSVEVKADNLHDLDWDDQQIAASRAVTNVLGEEMRIEEVHSVKTVFEFDQQDKEWIYPFTEFGERFLYFIEED